VRKLAEEAQSAAGQIASLIGEIQDATGRAITAVDHAGTLVVDGAETVEQTRVAFSQILDGTTSVDGALADVASVAEQNSAAAQQMSASSQEQERAAQDLAATSQELSAIVAQFRV
jgi:methyl-accepting chemotaxis protein